MHRVTISLDDTLAQAFDALVAEQGYASRSEAMRDLVRRAIDARKLDGHGTEACVANLSYVYDHHRRDLTARLTQIQHDQHDLVLSTTHVHLDHDTCLESTMLRGPLNQVRSLADNIQAQQGVRFGALNVVSASAANGAASG